MQITRNCYAEAVVQCRSGGAECWNAAVRRRQEESAHCVEFIPFSLEAGGVWGLAAKRFFERCVARADNLDRDVTTLEHVIGPDTGLGCSDQDWAVLDHKFDHLTESALHTSV